MHSQLHLARLLCQAILALTKDQRDGNIPSSFWAVSYSVPEQKRTEQFMLTTPLYFYRL